MSGQRQQTKARADLWFALYAEMGAARSIKSLVVRGLEIGAKTPAQSTIQRWSSDFGWQERVRAFDQAQAERALEGAGDQIQTMNTRQSQLGRALQGVAGKALTQLATPAGLREVGSAGVARLARDGVHIERLALGQATARHEIALAIVNVWIRAVAMLFQEVNALPDGESRARAFAEGADTIVREHFADIVEGPE